MTRLAGVEGRDAGLLTRILYFFVRRRMRQLTGRAAVPMPIRVHAHHPRLLRALGQMEMGQDAARSVPAALKLLAGVKAARLVGCPY